MPALRALPLLRRAALAALLLPPAVTTPAQQRQPRPALVEEINVSGTRRLSGQELIKRLQTRPGDPYNEEQVSRDFQTLMGLGLFDRRVSRVVTELGVRGGIVVSFELQELPVIESVKFEGLPAGDELALRVGLRRRGVEVRAGDVLDTDKLNAAVRVMERILGGRGWYNVAVEPHAEHVSSTSVKLNFVVRALPPERRLAPKRSDRLRRRDAIT